MIWTYIVYKKNCNFYVHKIKSDSFSGLIGYDSSNQMEIYYCRLSFHLFLLDLHTKGCSSMVNSSNIKYRPIFHYWWSGMLRWFWWFRVMAFWWPAGRWSIRRLSKDCGVTANYRGSSHIFLCCNVQDRKRDNHSTVCRIIFNR